MTETRAGRCLCGAVQYEADLNGPHFHVCHCEKCRRWGGGPAFATPSEAIRIEGEQHLAFYSSSKMGERAFCRECGTHLFWRRKTGEGLAVWMGALDQHDDMTFGSQIFIDSKPDSYKFNNKTGDLTGEQVRALFAAGK
jgi:hypothetical protein